jgi:hypothetical protein
VWVKVWVKDGVLYQARIPRGFQALKSRLVAGIYSFYVLLPISSFS